MAGFLTWRLYDVQIRRGPGLAHLAQLQRSKDIPLPAKRGVIFDRSLAPLARSLPSHDLYATTREIDDVERTARALAPILHKSTERIAIALREPNVSRLLAPKISRAALESVRKLHLAGITIVPSDTGLRYLSSGRLASTVLGFTGDQDNGLEGAEFGFERLLRGTKGTMRLERDQFDRTLPFARPLILHAATEGHSVALTLDSYLQYETERVLHATVTKFGARSGTAIVMDPNSGEILALANVPDYDVADFEHSKPDDRRDRGVTDAYEPGSTFKLITMAAALESGRVGADQRFPTRDRLQIGGSIIHNAEDGFMAGTGGSETLEDIVAYSHNVGAAEVGIATGRHALNAMIRRFGFGSPTNIELPGESSGIVPNPAQWSDTTLPTVSFGHGISTTPLALLRAYAAIANGGVLLRPRILKTIYDPAGRIVYRYPREVERRVISQRTARRLRRYLRAAVERGTGNPTARIPGYTTAGKTGTAQVASAGGYQAGAYNASFVGFVPAEHPRFAILVKVERPRGAIYGSVVAAPAFAQIGRAAMLQAGIVPKVTPSPSARSVGAGSASKSTP